MWSAKRKQTISEQEWVRIRQTAVANQIVDRGVRNERVLKAMREVPRHHFLPANVAPALAYADRPLPIGQNQTISQPYIVAYMAEKLALTGTETVLEVGTGCGYQAAVLAQLAKEVISLEVIPELAFMANENLARENITNVKVKVADGFKGWMEDAPYDRIIITAGAPRIPQALMLQLNAPGKLIAPIGPRSRQKLILIEKTPDPPNPPKAAQRELISVMFVPMRGEIERQTTPG
ncbi:MAG: protein-L-isoaspartate(D-aspartate) O-methyltransferase [Elusimicrobia bacterium]|nr:protein-L-isoaspartate(D-aspartate) O-methyltransferase [Elusimicrobiota bacterium]